MGEVAEEVAKQTLLKLLAGKIKNVKKRHPVLESLLYSLTIFSLIWFRLKVFLKPLFLQTFQLLQALLTFPLSLKNFFLPTAWLLIFLSIFYLISRSVGGSVKKEEEEGSSRFGRRVFGFLVTCAVVFISPSLFSLSFSLLGNLLPEFRQFSPFLRGGWECFLTPTEECFLGLEEEKQEEKVEVYDVLKFDVEKKLTYSPGSIYTVLITVTYKLG